MVSFSSKVYLLFVSFLLTGCLAVLFQWGRSGSTRAGKEERSRPSFPSQSILFPPFFFFLSRSSFFLFPQANFSCALSSYELALQASAQREVRLLCLHEVGWSHVLLLRWEDAADAFLALRRESRLSKSFYSYLSSGELREGRGEACLTRSTVLCTVGLS